MVTFRSYIAGWKIPSFGKGFSTFLDNILLLYLKDEVWGMARLCPGRIPPGLT
jgi:hypothetical protein